MGIGFMVPKEDLRYISEPEDLKSIYMDVLSGIPDEDIQELWASNEKKLVTLYHGTSSIYLNQIFREGIRPKFETQVENWESNPSHDRVVYLTNKWHYFFAENATVSYLEANYGENDDDEWPQDVLPCYVACKVPESLLMIDEDFLASKYVTNKLALAKRKHQDFFVFGEECLAQYGTAGIIGGIPSSAIYSFTIMSVLKEFSDPESQYMKDYRKWQEGNGKGKLKLLDLIRLEEKTWNNGTWFMNQFKGPPVIQKILKNPKTHKIAIQATQARL